MKTKSIILLGGFLFTLSLLSAQRIQKGLSIGMPSLVRIPIGDVYYNTISSGSKWWEEAFQLAPGYALTYHLEGHSKSQLFFRHSAYAVGFWRVYDHAENPWDYPEFYFRLGGGGTHYFSFAPAWQWQWEIGAHTGRVWRGVGGLYQDNPNASTEWRSVMPYGSLGLQTTTFGERLILGAGFDIMLHDDFAGLFDELMFITSASWSLRQRQEKAKKLAEAILDERAPFSIQLYDSRYRLLNQSGHTYSRRLVGLSSEYWWLVSDKLRWGSRLGIGYVYSSWENVPISKRQWLLEAEQNVYWRIHEKLPVLPYAGLGLLGGQFAEQNYDSFGNSRVERRNIFRPYLKLGARLHLPHQRMFLDVSASTFAAVHIGIGVRLGRINTLSQ